MKVTVEYGYFLAFSTMKHLRTVFLPVMIYDWIPVGNKRAVSVWENQQTQITKWTLLRE